MMRSVGPLRQSCAGLQRVPTSPDRWGSDVTSPLRLYVGPKRPDEIVDLGRTAVARRIDRNRIAMLVNQVVRLRGVNAIELGKSAVLRRAPIRA